MLCMVGDIEPFVGIRGDGVDRLNPVEEGTVGRGKRGIWPKSSIDVQPGAGGMSSTAFGHGPDRIKCAGVHLARVRDNNGWAWHGGKGPGEASEIDDTTSRRHGRQRITPEAKRCPTL